MSDQEMLGRLVHWSNALNQIDNFLRISQNADDLGGHENLIQNSSGIFEYSDKNEPFPNSEDWETICISCKLLAAVYFCQIYGTGNRKAGIVADNHDLKNLRQEMEKSIINDGIFMDDFCSLKSGIINLRNKFIAHVDGIYSDLSFPDWANGEPVYSTFPTSVIDIEIEMWRAIVRSMNEFVKRKIKALSL